jgi:hypothetical protein
MYSDLEILSMIDRGIANWASFVYRGEMIGTCPMCCAFPLCQNPDGQKCPIHEMTGVEDCETDEAPIIQALFEIKRDRDRIFSNHVLSFGYTLRLWWIKQMNKY